MELSIDYLAVVANSTLRMMTPILLVTLAAAICTKVQFVADELKKLCK